MCTFIEKLISLTISSDLPSRTKLCSLSNVGDFAWCGVKLLHSVGLFTLACYMYMYHLSYTWWLKAHDESGDYRLSTIVSVSSSHQLQAHPGHVLC